MAIFRLSGTVAAKADKPWATKDGTRSGTMPMAVIEVNDFVSSEVVLSDVVKDQIALGDVVDLIVDVTSSGGYLRVSATNFWPAAGFAGAALHAAS